MANIQFVSTAKCQVSDNFNLEEYVVTLVDFIANHIDDGTLDENIRCEFEFLTYDRSFLVLQEFFDLSDNTLSITVNSEEQNTFVYDWLISQVLTDVMTSNLMEINFANIGNYVECQTSYYMKDGTYIDSGKVSKILESVISSKIQ